MRLPVDLPFELIHSSWPYIGPSCDVSHVVIVLKPEVLRLSKKDPPTFAVSNWLLLCAVTLWIRSFVRS